MVGPTASGKSAIGVMVALQLGDIEIVTADSMQVYRGMDIGTAKPSPERASRYRPSHDRRSRPIRGVGRGSFCDRVQQGALPISRRVVSAPFSLAEPAFTCTRLSTASQCLASGPRWQRSSNKRGAPPNCTAGLPSSTRPRQPAPGRSTGGGYCERWRSQLAVAAPFPVMVPAWELSLRQRGGSPVSGCRERLWRGRIERRFAGDAGGRVCR